MPQAGRRVTPLEPSPSMSSPTTDPFDGNYTLIQQDDVLIAFQVKGNQARVLGFEAVADRSELNALQQQAALDLGSHQPGKHLALVTADFDGDHQDEVACAYNDAGTLTLVVARYQEDAPEAAGRFEQAGPAIALGAMGSGRVRAVTGRFTSGASVAPLCAIAWPDPSGQLQLRIWDCHAATGGKITPTCVGAWDGKSLFAESVPKAPTFVGGQFDMAAGDVDGDGVDEVLLFWQSKTATSGKDLFLTALKLRPAASGNPVAVLAPVAAVAIGTLGARAELSLAAGRFRQEVARHDVALAWGYTPPGDAPALGAALALYTYDRSAGGLTCTSRFQDQGKQSGFGNGSYHPLVDWPIIRVAAGDLNLDRTDELVLGYSATRIINTAPKSPDTSGSDATASNAGGEADGSNGDDDGAASPPFPVSFNDKPGTYGGVLLLRVFQVDQGGTLQLKSTGTAGGDWTPGNAFDLVSVDLQLAIGAVRGKIAQGSKVIGGIPNAIIVAALGADVNMRPLAGYSHLSVGYIPVTPDLHLPPQYTTGIGRLLGEADDETAQGWQLDITLGLALGNFTGKRLRLGKPKYIPVEEVVGVIAVINAPPLQSGLNYENSSDVSFNDEQQQQTSLQVTVTSTAMLSSSLEGRLNALGFDFHTGKTHMQTDGKITIDHSTYQIQQGLSASVAYDDVVIYSAVQYDVWEYPVYTDGGDTAEGHMLLIWPRGAPGKVIRDGKADDSFYAPRHELGNVLSYSPDPPEDFEDGNRLNEPLTASVATVAFAQKVDYSLLTSKGRIIESKQETSFSKGGGVSQHLNLPGNPSLSIAGSLTDTYDDGKSSNTDIGFQKQTAINIQISITKNVNKGYNVEPYVYWSNRGGYLVVDYAVTLPEDEETFWYSNYTRPHPTFCLPRATPPDLEPVVPSVQNQRSPSITFADLEDGQGVQITAEVWNYSLVDVTEKNQVTIQFYLGNPKDSQAQGGKIGAPIKIPFIPARGSVKQSVTWQPALSGDRSDYHVYCQITAQDVMELPLSGAAGGDGLGSDGLGGDDAGGASVDPSLVAFCDRHLGYSVYRPPLRA